MAEATVHFGRDFLVAAAMIGGPEVVTVQGLLLLLASRILGRRATLFCLGTDALFTATRSASRILRFLVPSAKQASCKSESPSRRQIKWTIFYCVGGGTISSVAYCASRIHRRAFGLLPTKLQPSPVGSTDTVSSTRLRPEAKPWYPVASLGTAQRRLSPTETPWTPAPRSRTKTAPTATVTPIAAKNPWTSVLLSFMPQHLLSAGLVALGKLRTIVMRTPHGLASTFRGTVCFLALQALRRRTTLTPPATVHQIHGSNPRAAQPRQVPCHGQLHPQQEPGKAQNKGQTPLPEALPRQPRARPQRRKLSLWLQGTLPSGQR